MRIGLVTQEYPPETAKGGIATQSYLKAHGLAEMGHQVCVISRSQNGESSFARDGDVDVVRVATANISAYTEIADWVFHSCIVAEEIEKRHRASPFDILDFPEWACEGYVHLLNQCEWNRIPTVLQLHGPLIMLARTLGWPDPGSEFFKVGTQMEATSLRLADGIYSSSECSADWCAREYQLDRERIPVLHTGVDTEIFYPRPIEKAEEPTIIFVGKMVRNKGVEVLVEAACEIADDFPDLRLRMLGKGEESVIESIRRKAAAKGFESLLDMGGQVERKELAEQLSRAHVFAAPSFYEGGPGFVYLEAMACGLPVIGCDGSGAAEVIRDGVNGLLVQPNDVTSLTIALKRLLSDRAERERMAAEAQKFVDNEANSSHCVARIEAFYRAVISAAGELQGK